MTLLLVRDPLKLMGHFNHGRYLRQDQHTFKFGAWTMQVGLRGAIQPLHIQFQVYNYCS